ncbi:uncharacterized protein LOC134262469 [Saccostrea cucullata]|uniref:uncharacterized protein LOC134262469 n=1 Tax=Saccostrea cuccullata TaxID=36930 RepID=UPI002ED02E4D
MDDEAEERKIDEIRKWSSFVLDDIIESNERTKKKLHLLQKDMDAGFDLKEENVRALNLISYLHWRLGERDKAFEALKKAQVVKKSGSLITLCNEILFHYEVSEFFQSRKLSENVDTHLNHKETQTRAVAEIAYFYSRFGPRHHEQAVQLFRKAIDELKPERNILWEFGLALTLQRQSHMFQMTDPEKFNPEKKRKEASSILYGIVKYTETDILPEYRQIMGKAWCRLGTILTKNENLFNIVNIDETKTTKINQKLCFEEALNLCPNNYFILQSYGQQLRYWWDLEKSREMLEKANQIQDMPFSRHHLAITLKKIVEKDTPKPTCRRNLIHSFSAEERQHILEREQYDSGNWSSRVTPLSLLMIHQTEGQNSMQEQYESGIWSSRVTPLSLPKGHQFQAIGQSQHDSKQEQYDSGISSMASQFSSISLSHPKVEQSSMYLREDPNTQRYQRARPFVRRSSRTRRSARNGARGYNPRYACMSKVEQSSVYLKEDHNSQRSRPFVRRSAGTRRSARNGARGYAPRFQQSSNTPFFRSQSDPVHTTRAFNAMRKSPMSVCHSPDNPLLIEAVSHLEKALEMDRDFNVARYELGLIYRMLDRTKDALDCFSFITSRNCGKPSEYKMTLINAFEQQGICKLKLKSKENDQAKKEELQYDAEKSMWNAVTMISGIIGAIPDLKDSNHCFPTLKSLLLKGDESPKTLKELAKLHELLKFYEESIGFYRRLIETESYDNTTVKKLIQNYIDTRDFENAICTLSLLQCTNETDAFEKSFYVDTYIKGANDSLAKQNFEMAKIRLLNAYQTIFPNRSSSGPEDDSNSFDVLVLHSCDEGSACKQKNLITSTLMSFVKLNVAVNNDDCPPFRKEMTYLKKVLLDSSCIIVLFHQSSANHDNVSDFVDLAIEMIPCRYRTKTLVINNEGNEHDLQVCKELILSAEFWDNKNELSIETLNQGTLFSDILTKLSEMFIKENQKLK